MKSPCNRIANMRQDATILNPKALNPNWVQDFFFFNYENSNISPCKNTIFKQKSSKTNQNPSRYHNSITNNLKVSTQAQISIIFQKSSYKIIPTTTWGPKSHKLLYSILKSKPHYPCLGRQRPTKNQQFRVASLTQVFEFLNPWVKGQK